MIDIANAKYDKNQLNVFNFSLCIYQKNCWYCSIKSWLKRRGVSKNKFFIGWVNNFIERLN